MFDVGGPYIGFKPFLEATAAYNTTSACHGLSAGLNWGVFVSLGAQLNIAFFNSTLFKSIWPGTTVFSVKQPIIHGCVTVSDKTDSGIVITPVDGMLLGDTWAGIIQVRLNEVSLCIDEAKTSFWLQQCRGKLH